MPFTFIMRFRNTQVIVFGFKFPHFPSRINMMLKIWGSNAINKDFGFRCIYLMSIGSTESLKNMIDCIKTLVSPLAKQNDVVGESKMCNVKILIIKDDMGCHRPEFIECSIRFVSPWMQRMKRRGERGLP